MEEFNKIFKEFINACDEVLTKVSEEKMKAQQKPNDKDVDRIAATFEMFGLRKEFVYRYVAAIKKVVADSNGYISYGDMAQCLASDDPILVDTACTALSMAHAALEVEKEKK